MALGNPAGVLWVMMLPFHITIVPSKMNKIVERPTIDINYRTSVKSRKLYFICLEQSQGPTASYPGLLWIRLEELIEVHPVVRRQGLEQMDLDISGRSIWNHWNGCGTEG